MKEPRREVTRLGREANLAALEREAFEAAEVLLFLAAAVNALAVEEEDLPEEERLGSTSLGLAALLRQQSELVRDISCGLDDLRPAAPQEAPATN